MTDAIEIASIGKTYDAGAKSVTALSGIDVTIREGEFVAILGPSGCGKSTLLNLIAGFEKPTGGTIRVFGQPVSAPGPERAVVFQESALFPWLTVWDNVVFGPKLASRTSSAAACGSVSASPVLCSCGRKCC
jgi:NitT/TauT family transport system ATP-binding protein